MYRAKIQFVSLGSMVNGGGGGGALAFLVSIGNNTVSAFSSSWYPLLTCCTYNTLKVTRATRQTERTDLPNQQSVKSTQAEE